MSAKASLGSYTGLQIKMAESLDKQSITNQIEAVISAVVEQASFDLSEQDVKAQTEAILANFVQQLATAGLTLEEYLRQSEKTYEQLFAELEVITAEVMKKDSVLSSIVEAEGLAVTDGDLRGKIGDFARLAGCYPEEMYQELEQNGRLESIYKEILWEKVVGFLLENNRFV